MRDFQKIEKKKKKDYRRDYTFDVRIYYSAGIHSCTLQCRQGYSACVAVHLVPGTVENPSVLLFSPISLNLGTTGIKPKQASEYGGGGIEEEEEPSEQMRKQEKVLKLPLVSAALCPQSCMDKSPPLSWAGETVVTRPQRKVGKLSELEASEQSCELVTNNSSSGVVGQLFRTTHITLDISVNMDHYGFFSVNMDLLFCMFLDDQIPDKDRRTTSLYENAFIILPSHHFPLYQQKISSIKENLASGQLKNSDLTERL